MNLNEAKLNEKYRVTTVVLSEDLKERMKRLGLYETATVSKKRYSLFKTDALIETETSLIAVRTDILKNIGCVKI